MCPYSYDNSFKVFLFLTVTAVNMKLVSEKGAADFSNFCGFSGFINLKKIRHIRF